MDILRLDGMGDQIVECNLLFYMRKLQYESHTIFSKMYILWGFQYGDHLGEKTWFLQII